MTAEEVARVRELLTHEDHEHQRQGLELAKSFGDYSAVFEGCSIDEDGKIQLSFKDIRGSYNNAMIRGLLESGAVSPKQIQTLRNYCTEGYSKWEGWIKRGYAAELELAREDFPADWEKAIELIEESKHGDACSILTDWLQCDFIDFSCALMCDVSKPSVSEFLELVCGETVEEVLDHLDMEIEDVGGSKVNIRKCAFDGHNFCITAGASFKFPNRLLALQSACESSGDALYIESGVTFQWSVETDSLTMITDTDETGIVSLDNLVRIASNC